MVARRTAVLALAAFFAIACGPGQGGAPAQSAPTSPATGEEDEAAFLFADDTVHTFELEISEGNLETLDSSPADEQYVEAVMVFAGERIGPVGLRYKGGIGSFIGCVEGNPNNILDVSGRKTCPKLGTKVSFNAYDRLGRWKGLKKLQFHAMLRDPSMMRERLNYGLFREMGVAASRVNHARLIINGEYAGLFALVEELDSRFLDSRFDAIEGGEGNLYKDAWPGRTSEATYNGTLRTNERDPDVTHSTMLTFGEQFQAARERGPSEVDRVVDAWMDLDYMMSFVAVDRAIDHQDGPMLIFAQGELGTLWPGAFFNHNFYWYAASDQNRLWPIPWDLDFTFQTLRILAIDVIWNDLNVECIIMANSSPIPNLKLPPYVFPSCEPLIRSWARRTDAFRAKMKELLDGPFSEAVVEAKLNRWSTQLEPYVAEDAEMGFGPSLNAWTGQVEVLRDMTAHQRVVMQAIVDR
jgi:spore coat protein H